MTLETMLDLIMQITKTDHWNFELILLHVLLCVLCSVSRVAGDRGHRRCWRWVEPGLGALLAMGAQQSRTGGPDPSV